MNLSNFFDKENIIRNTHFEHTHYADSMLPKTITFVLNEEFLKIANTNNNVVSIITNEKLGEKVDHKKGLIVSNDVKHDFFKVHNYLYNNKNTRYAVKSSVSSSAKISPTSIIGPNVFIGENVEIGHYTIIEEGSYIGANSIIGNHVTIGAKGLHNTRISDNEFIRVIDAGGVKIGENCEIASGSIIQKSYFCDATIIGKYTKLGPMVNIGHGVITGNGCLIAGGTVIAGFSEIGNNVWIGPSSTIAHGLKIGNNVQIKLGSIVITNLLDMENVSGNFAYSHKKNLLNFTRLKR